MNLKLSKILNEFKNSNRREDRMVYASFLKEIGVLGKRIYFLQPEITSQPWLKEWLIKLYNYLKNYDIKRESPRPLRVG